MTVVYGVTMYGAKWQIHKQLSDIPVDVRLYVAGYLARNVFKSLRKMFTKTREIQVMAGSNLLGKMMQFE